MLTPLFKELTRYKERFIAAHPTEDDLARFIYLTRLFHEGECRAIKLKFIHTGKMLKFSTEHHQQPRSILCHRLEKTADIVRDIHRIHKLVDEYTLPYGGDPQRLPLDQLWEWAAFASDGRIFPMERPNVIHYDSTRPLQDQQLYYGLIVGHHVHYLTDRQAVVTLHFQTGELLDVRCSRVAAANLSAGHIWVGNAQGCYRIAKLSTIRHHVMFERNEYQTLMQWLQGQMICDIPLSPLFSTY